MLEALVNLLWRVFGLGEEDNPDYASAFDAEPNHNSLHGIVIGDSPRGTDWLESDSDSVYSHAVHFPRPRGFSGGGGGGGGGRSMALGVFAHDDDDDKALRFDVRSPQAVVRDHPLRVRDCLERVGGFAHPDQPKPHHPHLQQPPPPHHHECGCQPPSPTIPPRLQPQLSTPMAPPSSPSQEQLAPLPLPHAHAQQRRGVPADEHASRSRVSVMPSRSQSNSNFEWEIPHTDLVLGPVLGEGGFGRVHRALWHGTEVAVKVLVVQRVSQRHVDEFVSEVGVLSKLRHPNVLLFLGACTAPPHLCIATELMAVSLFDVIHDPGIDLPVGVVVRILTAVACGMSYLHSLRPPIIHRDLKSANLLLDHSLHTVKVADFGLARTREVYNNMTAQRGTFQWMAPEVILGEVYGEPADVYSFAVIMWECVARKLPFAGQSGLSAAMAVANSDERPVIPQNTNPKYADLMTRCWHTNPALRPRFERIVEELRAMDV